MSAYLKHKVSLAGKRRSCKGSAPITSSPAVASSPSVDPHVRLPSVSEDSVIRDTVLSYLSSLSKSGSLGTNLSSFSAPSPVPDLAPSIKGVTGGESGPEPHNLGGPTRSSGVGAGAISSSAASIPAVLPNISVPLYVQPRFMQDVKEAVSQPLAYTSVSLASSGLDQSRFARGILYTLPPLLLFLLLLSCFLSLLLPLRPLPPFRLFLLFASSSSVFFFFFFSFLLFSPFGSSAFSYASSYRSSFFPLRGFSVLFLSSFGLPSFSASSFHSGCSSFYSSSVPSWFSFLHYSIFWVSFASSLFFSFCSSSFFRVSFLFASLFFFLFFSPASFPPSSFSSWLSSSFSSSCLGFVLAFCFSFSLFPCEGSCSSRCSSFFLFSFLLLFLCFSFCLFGSVGGFSCA